MSLRHQLRDTSLNVVEIAPPLVATDMTGGNGADANLFADDVIQQLLDDKNEITHKHEQVLRGSRDTLDAVFVQMNAQKMF